MFAVIDSLVLAVWDLTRSHYGALCWNDSGESEPTGRPFENNEKSNSFFSVRRKTTTLLLQIRAKRCDGEVNIRKIAKRGVVQNCQGQLRESSSFRLILYLTD